MATNGLAIATLKTITVAEVTDVTATVSFAIRKMGDGSYEYTGANSKIYKATGIAAEWLDELFDRIYAQKE